MKEKEQGFVSVVLAAVFGVLFLGVSIFAFSVYSGRQDLQNNFDEKVENAAAIAVQQAETAKDAEFVEKEKEPLRSYTGSATFGTVSFKYPKTWSIYAVETPTGVVLDLYASPGVVPGLNSNKPYALRVQITSTTYDSEVTRFDSALSSGKLSAQAFVPSEVPNVLGLKLTGEIASEVQGVIVLLPLRDRTIKVFTESQEFVNDFNTFILPSIKFVP